MEGVKFFVEGDADVKFISDFLIHLGRSDVSRTDFVIVNGNSESLIRDNLPEFERSTAKGNVNLLIFDADGDKYTTQIELERIKGILSIQFESFLFPNNLSSGTLENLLIGIVPEANKTIFDCFNGFEECLKMDNRFSPPILKSRVYAYVDSLLTKKERKEREKHADEKYRNYLRKDHWNLDSIELKALKEFCEKYLVR